MSTTNITSWAVDLADIGVIYPFAGYEGAMVAIGIIGWLAWHVWCHRWENEENDKIVAAYHEKLKSADDKSA
ncbi:MAG TPA: hypothetical protein DE179_00100 [Oceanospirillaceae bacterium]|nr:hypothetical protein [Oceanospirillaceae bacterium]